MSSTAARTPGLPRSLDYPDVGVGAVVLGAGRRWGGRTAFARGDESLTFAELADRSVRLAQGLKAGGVRAGDRVAVKMPNRLEFPVAYYGVLLAGAVFVPVNPAQPEAAVAAQIADSGAVLTLTEADVPRLCAGQAGDDAPPVPREGLAHLAYTGGTTGVSKGVRLPHRNVVTNVLQYCCWATGSVPALDGEGGLTLDQVGSPEKWPVRLGEGVAVNLTPWFHAMGTIAGLNAVVMTGTTTVLHDRLDPAHYLADSERLRVTSVGGAPALFAVLLAHPESTTRDFSSVRMVSSGAAPMPLEMAARLRDVFPNAIFAEGYGLTEVTMGATVAPTAKSALRKHGTVGPPVFDTEVRIASLETGEEQPTGERGEVWIRGPQVMEGYHNNPEATAEVLTPEGWLRTGDIGFLDEDGYLSVVDRIKDMLLYKGYNVYPRELEELLTAHPDVAMGAVVGRPDPKVGELPVAFVVPARAGVDPEKVMGDVNAQVAPYKHLREVRLVASIPVSAAGKILKRDLRVALREEG